MKKNHLRAERTSFVGRRRELRLLRELLARRGLVSLVGPPGVGKTRLALRFAHARAGAYPGGAWVVDARDLRSVAALAGAVASALGLEVPAGEADLATAVGRRLAERGRILLVLDNVDRLVAPASAAVAGWRAAAERAHFLFTSREPLRLDREQRMEVGPLWRDREDPSEAVRLFVDRARALRADYAPSRAALAVIAEIARRLDGIPLAIELAATRLTALSETELLAWLPSALDRAGARGRESGTLRRAIGWSWELLDAPDRRALAACSVFSGGFSLDAAARVLAPASPPAAVLERLQSLREKSLLFEADSGRPHAIRFGVYESIAEFARGKLRASGAAPRVERRHTAYYVAEGARWAAQAREHADAALGALALEERNLGAVVARARGPRANGAARAAALSALVALEPLASTHGPLAPYLALLDRALDRAGHRVPAALLARALLARGRARVLSGSGEGVRDLDRAQKIAQRLRDSVTVGLCVMDRGLAHSRRGQLDLALADYAAARALFRRTGQRALECAALGQQGLLLYRQGKLDEALAHYEQQIPLLPDDAIPRSIAHVRMGGVQHDRGELRAARAEYRRALALARRAGARRYEATAHAALGLLHWEMGQLERARAAHRRAIAASRAFGDPTYLGICLASMGALEATMGRIARASRLLARARRLLAQDNNRILLTAVDVYDAMLLFAEAARLGRSEPARAAALAERAGEQVARARRSVPLGEDTRVALRILDGSAGVPAPSSRGTRAHLVVHERGEWFRAPGGPVVRLDTKRTLQRLLVALVERRCREPGVALRTHDLVATSWPGEFVSALAGANRLYVALAALRKAGLKSLLVRAADGYLLDPRVEMSVSEAKAK